MTNNELTALIETTAAEFGIPGIAVGILHGGREEYAAYGVTSVAHPLPVDEHTVFALGSISKPVTATALMRLVADGRVELDAPVRRYVPELALRDGREITVLQLLNHTAGLDWSIINDTGEGDDGLAAFVDSLSELPLIAEPGARSSYSQAGYNLLGRVIEKVTGQTFEQAIAELVLRPVGMTESCYSRDDIMTRRFAVGHERGPDGELSVARIWKGTRANNPGGGLASTVADQLRWARFQLGDGRNAAGETVLPAAQLLAMREPTVELRASLLGDALGLCWFLREIDGVRTFGHGGSGYGQFGELLLVPEHDFAIIVLSNASPDSVRANQTIVRWALERYLGVIDADPEPVAYDATAAAELVGCYEIDSMTMHITSDGSALSMDCKIRPEIRAASETELPQDHPAFEFALLPGDGDEYVVTKGSFKGQRGFFSRDAAGVVTGVDLAGRLFTRTR